MVVTWSPLFSSTTVQCDASAVSDLGSCFRGSSLRSSRSLWSSHADSRWNGADIQCGPDTNMTQKIKYGEQNRK